MARLQILELPEGSGDDRPPFVLVIDQASEDIANALAPTESEDVSYATAIKRLTGLSLAEQIGARAVLVFGDTIDIPANDTTAYLRDREVSNEVTVNLGDQDVRDAIAADMQKMREANEDRILDSRQDCLDAQRLADERTDIARDMDRLATRKHELLDALGMDHTRDWDDIRNAATGLRKQRDAQAEAIERVRNLHRPVDHRGVTICWECSAYDFASKTTDNSPCGIEHCPTLKALSGEWSAPDA